MGPICGDDSPPDDRAVTAMARTLPLRERVASA
jgi:hypothetical protein